MGQQVTGTFSGTGQSASVSGSAVHVMMDFAGTATVDVQEQLPNGAWITHESATADYRKIVDSIGPVRLNCTAYTNNVDYALISK